jgi:hypothetical protein
MLRVYPSTRRPGAKAANLCMVKKTELVVTQESDYAILAFLNKKTTDKCTGWEITIAPGVDPALVICTAAIVEDTTSILLNAMRGAMLKASFSSTNLASRGLSKRAKSTCTLFLVARLWIIANWLDMY